MSFVKRIRTEESLVQRHSKISNEDAIRLEELMIFLRGIFKAPVRIAGGCARDLKHGVPFKDVDIIIPVKGIAIKALEYTLISFSALKDAKVGVYHSNENYPMNGGKVSLVCKLNEYCDFPIDVIMWKEDSLEGILKNFDCNMNRYILNDVFVPRFAGGNNSEGVLEFNSNSDLSNERMSKMKAKAEELGWRA